MERIARSLARRLRIPPGSLRSDLPERFGIPSLIAPDLQTHWRRVLSRSEHKDIQGPRPDGPRVALVTPIGKGDDNSGYTAVIAHALRLRGARPFVAYCDAWLEGCEWVTTHDMPAERYVEVGPRPFCAKCSSYSGELYDTIGIETHRLSGAAAPEAVREALRFADELPRERYFDFEYRGMALGPQVEATVTRFFYVHRIQQLGEDATMWRVARRIVQGTVMAAEAVLSLYERLEAEIVLVHYGAYASRGTALEAARLLGKRAVVWSRGYSVEETLMFGDGDNSFVDIAAEPPREWADRELTDSERRRVEDVLFGRVAGGWRAENPGAVSDRGELVRALDLDLGRPVIALYTNVGFDTKLFYDTPQYPDVVSWILDSIELFRGRREQLVIRVHPAETWLPTIDKQQTLSAIHARFPVLPENVRIIPADGKLSSYTLAEISTAAVVYGSVIGLELAARGVPVIVCGRGPYRGKGFTFDVLSRTDYERALSRLPEITRPDPSRTERAMRFAHYFYIQRNIPFAFWNHDIHPGLRARPWWKVFRSLADLRPGRNRDLDAICEQILHGRLALARA